MYADGIGLGELPKIHSTESVMLRSCFSGRSIAQVHRCHALVDARPHATRHQRKLPIELLEMQARGGRTSAERAAACFSDFAASWARAACKWEQKARRKSDQPYRLPRRWGLSEKATPIRMALAGGNAGSREARLPPMMKNWHA